MKGREARWRRHARSGMCRMWWARWRWCSCWFCRSIFIEGRGIGMLDILAIKADVYQLERQGKRLTVYRYLR